MIPTSEFAPVAIFAFNRPGHLLRLLRDMETNPEFDDSPLFIFCDGARTESERCLVEQVRIIAKDFCHSKKVVVESKNNQGLANSIINGVSQLCSAFGCVIVVEDDLAIDAGFLTYMNSALKRYAGEPRVMQISGHIFPFDASSDDEAFFMPVTTSWGWATWERAWSMMEENRELALLRLRSRRWRYDFDLCGCFPNSRMLLDRLRGNNNSWAIWWYFNVFEENGLVLFPARSFVNNKGFDGTGTHCANKFVEHSELLGVKVSKFPEVEVNVKALQGYGNFLKHDRGFIKVGFDHLWRIFYPSRVHQVDC